ncbi:MAG TPA: GTP-binding protein [Thermoanaerobaculia bacterium]|jgi:elongation factor Tu|nr:GTP-binding protein [Thermoanaerobaculia bacterium]
MMKIFNRWRASALVSLSFSLLFCCAMEISAQQGSAQPSKPVVRVATIGHQDHGKSTLAAAITRVLSDTGGAKLASYNELANASEISVQGVKLAAAQVEYETEKARYVHVDCRAAADCEKLLSGKVKLDGVILVVSAADGPMPQTREQIVLAHKSGIESVIVYLNKVDLIDDPELLQLVELEVRELLTMNGFKGDTVPFIRGSALMALRNTRDDIGKSSILKLLSAMDAAFAK